MLNNKYGFLIFLLLLNVVCQIDRNIIIGFAPQITEDLDLSDAQFGILSGALFSVFYSVGGLVMGGLADRYKRTTIIGIGLFAWSALTAATGLAKNLVQMGAARMMVSVGEATLYPAATSLLADKFPLRQRATAMGIFFMGVPLGLGGSYLAAGFLGPIFGWRNTFIILGLIGVALVGILLLLKEPSRGLQEGKKVEHIALREIPATLWRTMRDIPTVRLAIVASILWHYFYAGQVFSQLWLVRERGFEWESIVTTYGIISLTTGVAGSLLGGILSDWYSARFKGGRAGFIIVVMMLLSPLVIGYRFISPESPWFFVAMGSGFFMITSVYGPSFSILQDAAPIKVRASIVGATMLLVNVLALGTGSALLGWASDLLSLTNVSQPLTWVLLTSDVIALSAIPLYLIIARNRSQPAEALQASPA